ncbi:hypothetical protein [Clostridium cellulovorans]|uniref:Uncharacterized protein n=1 Tax=Clostridium cellulovorans (strain ATCC 35296 / DSM 3052 / OCM 3 / 743B) TaxID=573061 RepID=D9SKR4_CLOC7|nr:hypothetical protein [Clostridium cellulovorans]ADL53486.1 hypothetical protein Clocel_3816 [Clostridium cellulovorans 743B]
MVINIILGVLIVVLLAYIVFLNDSLAKEKRKNSVLNHELNLQHLKGDGKKLLANVEIRYCTPKFRVANILNDTALYIAPIETIAIGKIPSNLLVQVLDQAVALEITWYYVTFTTTNNVNNKGWVRGEDIVFSMDPQKRKTQQPDTSEDTNSNN